jgi:hypothetical protein
MTAFWIFHASNRRADDPPYKKGVSSAAAAPASVNPANSRSRELRELPAVLTQSLNRRSTVLSGMSAIAWMRSRTGRSAADAPTCDQ